MRFTLNASQAQHDAAEQSISVLQRFDLVRLSQVFVAQQRNGHIAVLPHKVMEVAQVEFVALCQSGFRQ
jgi:hypothetical protein